MPPPQSPLHPPTAHRLCLHMMFVESKFQPLPRTPMPLTESDRHMAERKDRGSRETLGKRPELFSKKGVCLLKELVYFSLRQVPQRQSQTGTGPDSKNITITMHDRGRSDGRCQAGTPCGIKGHMQDLLPVDKGRWSLG